MKKSRKKRRIVRCEDCDECQYIGEGDRCCMDTRYGNPAIVLENYSQPTDDYMRCERQKKTKQ